ncbi:trihelix transcription factor GTL1 [Cynara cardunculus var. scolymus]|uniref:Homeodomain-like protein n=1 Tax=Cynara cardunculus var. scolymus TaxID=59895 RepID=A0A118JXW0_CYNCS|nr:trihelix transcription factor GTL1 [Cynara cardunculus var. scolymus]KVH96702.1 Homeodomain-like protein [Cynara cardunculus var. scolymus]
MEVFTGDHGLPSDVVLYPDTHLSPFTLPNADTFSDQHKIPTDHHHFLPPQPPQKLRPIRCNGRSFSECCSSDDPLDVKPLSWPPETGFYNTETDDSGFVPPKASTLGLSFEECQTEAALSSSSDEGTKLQEAIKEPITKKRKRKSRKKLELFIESMMKTVMEKQEEMHKQLIEILDKKESERIMREEAWKQQEIERAKRDEKARAQEISRSLSLISFIQNSLGQEIQIPNPFNASNPNKQDENQNEESFKCDTGNDNNEESECDSNIRRWPKSEVQALITVRAALNQKFNHKGPKGSIWEEVAAGLGRMGYNRTPKKCKEKWENINKYYRRTMDKGKESGGRSTQAWSYFSELEMLYKNGFISGNSHDEDQNTKEMH